MNWFILLCGLLAFIYGGIFIQTTEANKLVDTVSYLPFTRSDFAAAASPDVGFYFAGGTENEIEESTMNFWSPNGWQIFNLPDTREDGIALGCRNYLLVLFADGLVNGNFSTQVDIYNSDDNSWFNSGQLSIARRNMGGVCSGNWAIFAGGIDNQGEVSSRVDLLYLPDMSWSTAELSQPRYSLTAADGMTIGSLTEGSFYFAGGFTDPDEAPGSATVDIYTPSSDRWTSTTLSQARGYMSTANVYSINSKGWLILFAGGSIGASGGGWTYFDNVDVYDIQAEEWSLYHLSVARDSTAAGNLAGSMSAPLDTALFAGGTTLDRQGNYISVSVVDYFNATSKQWQTTNLSQPRSDLQAVGDGSRIWFVDGAYGENTTLIDVFSFEGDAETNTQHPILILEE